MGSRSSSLLQVPEGTGLKVRLLCARRVDSQHGPATTVLDPAVISREGISEWEIPCPRRRASPMANGIPLAVQRGAVDLRRLNPTPDPLRARAAGGASLVQITRQDQPA